MISGCGAVELAIPYSDKLIRKYKTAHTIGKTTPGGESGGDARFAYSSIAFFVNISDKKATPNGIKNDKMSFFKFNVLNIQPPHIFFSILYVYCYNCIQPIKLVNKKYVLY